MEYYPKHADELSQYSTGKLEYKNGEYYIDSDIVANNRGLHGDTVYYDQTSKSIMGIHSRSGEKFVGVLRLDDNKRYGFNKKNLPYVKFSSVSGKYPDFIVPCKLRSREARYCIISLNRWDTRDKHPVGQIEEYLGEVSDEYSTVKMLLAKVGIRRTGRRIEYNQIPDIQSLEPDYHTFSIDPQGCRDIDDAFHFKKYTTGETEIGIHIANVARHLKSAKLPFFSSIYYRNGEQDNMIGNDWSYNICSLVNGEHRMALSLIIKFRGDCIVSKKFQECIVKNTALSYNEANSESCKAPGVRDLLEFSRDYFGEPDLNAQKMLEKFMIIYNSSVASKLYYSNPDDVILRTHQGQKDIKRITSTHIALDEFINRRQMEAAIYAIAPEDTAHKTLGLDFYTHATSPIRRYVDIINQHMLISCIDKSYTWSKEDFLVDVDEMNAFNKSLRKFYNHYKKLEIIHSGILGSGSGSGSELMEFEAFIVGIKGVKLEIYIPELDITHKTQIISPKLLMAGDVKFSSGETWTIVNDAEYSLYQRIQVSITPRPSECVFNRKLHVCIIE